MRVDTRADPCPTCGHSPTTMDRVEAFIAERLDTGRPRRPGVPWFTGFKAHSDSLAFYCQWVLVVERAAGTAELDAPPPLTFYASSPGGVGLYDRAAGCDVRVVDGQEFLRFESCALDEDAFRLSALRIALTTRDRLLAFVADYRAKHGLQQEPRS